MATRTAINPWSWSEGLGFVQAVESRDFSRIVHCAGQTSADENGRLLHPGDMAAQLGQALDNVETVLAGAGLSLGDVTRLSYYTTDVDAFLAVQAEHLLPRLRAAGCQSSGVLLGVARLASPGMLIEIEATAVA
jgi:enamine deaminase RidA (YjgF/YER057c/UK114 family)